MAVDTSIGITAAGSNIKFSDAVKLLGVNLDRCLTMDSHVASVVRSCNFHIRALRHIRPRLTLDAAKSVAASIVGSRLDYCNSLLYGTSQRNYDRLQRVQNALARAVTQASWRSGATELRRELHWLPIRQRVEFKLGVIARKVIYTGTPGYLASAISLQQPSRSLRSSSAPLLLQPFAPSNFCKNSFSTAVPALWNRLPSSTRNTVTLTAFRSDFKTLLFNRAYTP